MLVVPTPSCVIFLFNVPCVMVSLALMVVGSTRGRDERRENDKHGAECLFFHSSSLSLALPKSMNLNLLAQFSALLNVISSTVYTLLCVHADAHKCSVFGNTAVKVIKRNCCL